MFKSFKPRYPRYPVILQTSSDFFERLMCEVEFWEVFYGKNEGFYSGAFSSPLVDCRIAKLVSYSCCYLIVKVL
jgi:hypothetical protein